MATTEFSFLVTTDNHMGFKYDDPLRKRDSFMAFKEALQIARNKDVDFILLGGDLFHMNKPNPAIEHKCIKILRQHMNEAKDKKTVLFKRIQGEFSHFEQVKHGNFEDPSLKVPYPIMTIHGNHDDPTGPAGKSVVEKLATCGLLNYFGKVTASHDNKIMRIEPIVFEKDSMKLALYGIGFVPDKKLRSSFDEGLVRFKEPPKDTFNILVVHQNRRNYTGNNSFLPDSIFPTWFHLIIRGHEHDAVKPEIIPESEVGGIVYQPGSTVATSIEIREGAAKQVALMTVILKDPRGDQLTRYRLQSDIIDLKCYRRMIFRDIYQKEVFKHIKNTDSRTKLTPIEYRSAFRTYVVSCIDEILERHESQETTVSATEPTEPSQDCQDAEMTDSTEVKSNSVYKKLDRLRLPLLRVRLEFKNRVECFDDLEVGSLFYPILVANRDIIKFRKQKIVDGPNGAKANATFADDNPDVSPEDDDAEGMDVGQVEAIDLQEERENTVDALILNYFKDKQPNERLKAISLDEYTKAVRDSDEDSTNVISKVLSKKRNTLLLDYKSAIADEHSAALHFGDEAKALNWFLSAFKGEKPILPPNGHGGDEATNDSDEVIIWDDDF